MDSRKWTISFIIGILLCLGIFMLVNFKLDSVGYFAAENQEEKYIVTDYVRAAKLKYLKAHGEKYEAVVLGGSKSGTVSTSQLEQYTGKKWYNMAVNSPNFTEYSRYVEYLTETTEINEILLYLSSHEVNRLWEETDEHNRWTPPAFVYKSPAACLSEAGYYLTLDIDSNIKNLEAKEEMTAKMYFDAESGVSVYTNYNKACESSVSLKKWTNSHALKGYWQNITELFCADKSDKLISCDENIKEMEYIRDLCKEKNIRLTVVVGPTFITELRLYEGEKYWAYFTRLARTVDLWDFSGLTGPTKNPYNFIDGQHVDYKLQELVIDTVYGKDGMDGFGVYLTGSNIDRYITQRRENYYDAREEYKKTGTVQLFDMNSETYIDCITKD